MIPSNRWFPGSLAERAVWFLNFYIQFAEIAASLGFTPAEVTSVDNDNQVIQFLADIEVQLAAFKQAVREYRVNIAEKEIGKPTPAFPKSPSFTLPIVVPTGIFERLDNLVDRIRVAPNYTTETGALLGILPKDKPETSRDSLRPVAKVAPAFANYKFTVHATRLGMPSYKVQIRRMESEAWIDAGFSTTADIEITVTPTTPGSAERLQVRVILLDKNETVGQPSDAIYVTINP